MEKEQNKRMENNKNVNAVDEKQEGTITVKPVTVKIEDFRKDLNEVVAGSELTPFLLEMILGEMLAGISSVAQKEYARDRKTWEKACEEGVTNGGHQ